MSGPLFSSPPLASLRDSSTSGRQNEYSFNSKIMVAAMTILFIVVVFVVSLHIYAKWFWQRGTATTRWSAARALNAPWWHRRRRPADLTTEEPMAADVQRCIGLGTAIVNSLPTFVYGATSASHEAEPLLDCAVCLSEFQLQDRGRTLPNCKHSFHIDCIDMWFRSHATCPLCRTAVLPLPRQELWLAGAPSNHLPPFLHHTSTTMHQEHHDHDDSNSQSAQTSFRPPFLLQDSGASMVPREGDQEPPHVLPSMPSLELYPQQELEGFPSHAKTASPACTHVSAASASGAHIPPGHGELVHRDNDNQVSFHGRVASESLSIWPDNLRQQERVGIARSASLSFSRSVPEDAQASLAQPQKSSSFRMSIKWLVSRELSRGKSKVFPFGKVHGEPAQSTSSMSLPI